MAASDSAATFAFSRWRAGVSTGRDRFFASAHPEGHLQSQSERSMRDSYHVAAPGRPVPFARTHQADPKPTLADFPVDRQLHLGRGRSRNYS